MANTRFSLGVLMLVIASAIIILVLVLLFVGKTETGQKSAIPAARPVPAAPPSETAKAPSDDLVALLSAPNAPQEYSVSYNYDYGKSGSAGDVAFTVKAGSITHLESRYSNAPSYSQTFSYSCSQVYDSATATDVCRCDVSSGSPDATLTKEDCAKKGLKHELSTVWTVEKMTEEAKYRLTDWKDSVVKSGDCYRYGRHPPQGNFQDYEACFKDGVLVKYSTNYSDMGNTGWISWSVV